MTQEFEPLFAKVRRFGWDPDKRDRTVRERDIDFEEARFLFDGPFFAYRSDRKGEERYLVFGFVYDVEMAVVCALRGDLCWTSQQGEQADVKEKNITIVSRGAPRRKGRTNWERLRNMTDEEIEASIANDADWEEFRDVDWSKAVLVIPPKKRAISIRIDDDVLDYFKKEGAGYQRRMNAVLRSYMEQKRKKRA